MANTWEKGPKETTGVGAYEKGKSAYGCFDMAGNVWEWTADRQKDGWMWVRGGSWNYFQDNAACAIRNYFHPDFRDYVLGFRCART